MVYFELYGLPGAGKSTVSNIVVAQLKSRGYKLATYDDIYYRLGRGYFRKIRFYLEVLYHFSEYRLFFYFFKLYKCCHKRNIRYLNKLIYFSHQILMTANSGSYDIIFLDEGLIQFISSLFYAESYQNNKYLKNIVAILDEYIKINPVFCSIEVNESMQRIKNRPYQRKTRYSFSVGSSMLKSVLEYRNYNLKSISSAFPPHIQIDMLENVEDNANLIVEKVKSLIDVRYN